MKTIQSKSNVYYCTKIKGESRFHDEENEAIQKLAEVVNEKKLIHHDDLEGNEELKDNVLLDTDIEMYQVEVADGDKEDKWNIQEIPWSRIAIKLMDDI